MNNHSIVYHKGGGVCELIGVNGKYLIARQINKGGFTVEAPASEFKSI